jgi:hypothetical protein
MKRNLLYLLSIVLISACSTEPDLTVTGTIKGLKKGTVYLKKAEDSVLIAIDSFAINGEVPFELHADLEEPEVMILNLDDNTTSDYTVAFFADKGITTINTTFKRFGFDAKITGGDQQKRLNEYTEVARRFDNKALDLIKERFEADQSGDTVRINEAYAKTESNLKRKYLYTINFALSNKDSEIAPYLALTEIFDANIKYLDTIYNVLPGNILNSKYGIELKEFMEIRKADENIE